MKNIAIFVMSPFSYNKKQYDYTDYSSFNETCIHTNESGLKYLMHKMSLNGEKLDYAYAIVTKEVTKIIEEFVQRFEPDKYPLILPSNIFDTEGKISSDLLKGEIDFYKYASIKNENTLLIPYALHNEGSLNGVFSNIKDLFDKIIKCLGEDKKNVKIHVDITGGQRPASMLLLAIVQMLKFYGYETGYVIYSNLTNKDNGEIEDAADLLEMYDLMSGTQAFISYGDVNEIKGYFGNKDKTSAKLKDLLGKMQKLSSALKICASYEAMVKILAKLKDAIDKYEASLQTDGSIDDRELFFSELLPKIQFEYGEILPKEGKNVDVVGLIRWCLNKDMLQQAMTIYTEWLPDFIIDNKYIEIKDKNIINQCKQQNKDAHQSYKSWQQRFLRGYVMPPNNGKISTLTLFNKLLNEINYNIINFDSTKHNLCDTLNKFMDDVKLLQFRSQNKEDKFAILFSKLEAEHPIKAIFNAYKTDNSTVNEFACIRFSRAKKSVSECILESIKQVKNREMANILGIDDQYSLLLKTGKIKLSITEQEMLDIIDSYKLIVDEYRNKSNHSKAIEGNNKLIKDTIEKSLIILRK